MFGITAMISLPVLAYIALSAKPGQNYLIYVLIFMGVVAINGFAVYYDHVLEVRERQRRYFEEDDNYDI